MCRKILVLAVLGASCLASSAANAAVDYYLKFDGITGGSVAKGHEGASDIDSFDWGLSTARGGKPAFDDFKFTKRVDKSTPILFVDTASGKHLKHAVLDVVQAGAAFSFLTMTFSDVVLTSLHTSASAPALPTDFGSFGYSSVEMEVTTQKADGSAGQTFKGIWRLANNTPGLSFVGDPQIYHADGGLERSLARSRPGSGP